VPGVRGPLGRAEQGSSRLVRASIFQIEGLTQKPDPKEMKRKMHEDMISSIRNFLIYAALLRVTPFILKKLDST
ncbi:mitochondrial import receptor subunit TOM5 homolog, partial [Chlorocebus sabaeus]|uniref:mitochondrial import receptor subunit TOM5 homolog n=1 Tax=Chlorocebus sabaeus TaxID=60711 RepID=UPI0018B0CDC2